MSEVNARMDQTKAIPASRWRESIRTFVGLSFAWLIVLLFVRLGEWIFNAAMHGGPSNFLSFLGTSLLNDIFLFGKVSLILFILFLPLSLISLKAARWFYLITVLLLTLVYFALLYYFNSTMVLLGADAFGYSWPDMTETINTSGSLNVFTILLMIVIAALVWFAFIWLSPRIEQRLKRIYLFFSLIISAGLLGLFIDWKPGFEKEYDSNLSQNKLSYFLTASYRHAFPAPAETDIYADSYIDDYGNPGDDSISVFSYVDEKQFPFLHTENNIDVLSPFFNKSSKAPNIVIIIVEGLGRAFANENAYLGNFTPFLDSLSQHSLYWENCLSGGGRTFAVMPTILGSLPFGRNGFSEMKDGMPPHLSLPSLLKKNGYTTGFFYCGDASFDNMDLFAKQQGMSVADRKSFPAGYELLPSNSSGFSWGYGDKELYRYFFQQHAVSTQPSLQVLMTVATHSPFLVNDQQRYEKKFEERLNTLRLKNEDKEERKRYHQQYESILYADDALQTFFSEYRKRQDFTNTIFIVTGDHRMPEIPMSSKIDRYHVPLLIYSPMLKRAARFPAISTHFDLTPSLISFLSNSYQLSKPSQTHWLGSGLDTAHTFRNIHANALMQTKNDLVDFVMGKYHLNGEELYELKPNLGEAKISNEEILRNMQSAFQQFKQKNELFIKGARLLNDSTYKNYHP